MSLFGNGTDAVPIPKFIYALRIWEGNKFLDFKEHAAGPDLAAQIDLAHYLPDDAATALELAINEASSGASGASAIYDVSYDRSTDKFTISRTASGASSYADNAFELLFNSGSSSASGAGTGFGYDVASDVTGASAYLADNQLPNRIVPSQPIRSPEAKFIGENRESITESGIHTANHIRTDIFFEWLMMYIPEDELQDDWAEWMGKVSEVDGPWSQKLEFEFYPKATDTVNYIVLHPDDADWEPVEMISENLPAFYRWQMATREVIPKGGTLSLVDIYSRIPG